HAWLELRHDQKWCGAPSTKDKATLNKHKLLDSLIAKTEALTEPEIALKNKLINEMLSIFVVVVYIVSVFVVVVYNFSVFRVDASRVCEARRACECKLCFHVTEEAKKKQLCFHVTKKKTNVCFLVTEEAKQKQLCSM
uniref:Uncharacterized protein n=1 Tax=Brassica oleracea var. oleracea TaxID=109376 RepID=A0A0D2ZWW4_BRAOL